MKRKLRSTRPPTPATPGQGDAHARTILIGLLLAGLLGAGGCAQMEIEQGNYLTAGQVEKMKTGMRRAAVRRTLGKPPLQDPFHPDRWDYVFMRISETGERTYRRLTVFFNEEGRVERMKKAGSPFPEGYVPSSGGG